MYGLEAAAWNTVCIAKAAVTQPDAKKSAAIVQIGYWVALAAYFPKSLPAFIIFQFWFPMAISTAIIYPPIERAYDLEARIRDLHGE